MIYAGATAPNLNGARPANLDVVLFKLPTRESRIATARNAVQVRTAIVTNPYWSSDERQAVLGVMNELGSSRGTATPLVWPSARITGRFWRSRYRSRVLLSRRKNCAIDTTSQRLRYAQASPHLFDLGPLDFPTNSDTDDRLEQAGPDGYSQVIVLCMFQRIDSHYSTDCISWLAGAGCAIIHRLACLFTIGILYRTYFRGCCCTQAKRAAPASGRSTLKIGSQSQRHIFRE
jgi:hypothetical protein